MFSFLKRIFKKKERELPVEDPMKKFLIVGLGNIGPKYTNTRHNIGFKVLDAFAKAKEATFETEKLGDIAKTKVKGKTVVLLKPSTYMNLSGKAVRYWLQQEKIPLENLLVITDDLNLEFGFSKGRQVDYVLGEWTSEEDAALPERLEKSCEVITSFIGAGISNTMNAYNGK